MAGVVLPSWAAEGDNVDKYAGVILDHYDDQGATLKTVFPRQDDLPDMIKSAEFVDRDWVADDQYALIMQDGPQVLKKFACNDPGVTATSIIYYMEHGHKLPEPAQKTAAARLVEAAFHFGLTPPETLIKKAGRFDQPNKVDVTGHPPQVKVAYPQPESDNDYAVCLPDGRRLYPIHDWDHLKMASEYWEHYERDMDPGLRRQFAEKLAVKAKDMGYPLREKIAEAGARTFATPEHLRMALEMRKMAVDEQSRETLDDLLDTRGNIGPTKYAAALRRFDVEQGLDRQWGSSVLDPYQSTYGRTKVAKVVWNDGPDRITDEELQNLANLHIGDLDELFSEHFVRGFERDPVSIFNSMPMPQKRILARLAGDKFRDGSSEGQSLMGDGLSGS